MEVKTELSIGDKRYFIEHPIVSGYEGRPFYKLGLGTIIEIHINAGPKPTEIRINYLIKPENKDCQSFWFYKGSSNNDCQLFLGKYEAMEAILNLLMPEGK